jgi:hypothetical protein
VNVLRVQMVLAPRILFKDAFGDAETVADA